MAPARLSHQPFVPATRRLISQLATHSPMAAPIWRRGICRRRRTGDRTASGLQRTGRHLGPRWLANSTEIFTTASTTSPKAPAYSVAGVSGRKMAALRELRAQLGSASSNWMTPSAALVWQVVADRKVIRFTSQPTPASTPPRSGALGFRRSHGTEDAMGSRGISRRHPDVGLRQRHPERAPEHVWSATLDFAF